MAENEKNGRNRKRQDKSYEVERQIEEVDGILVEKVIRKTNEDEKTEEIIDETEKERGETVKQILGEEDQYKEEIENQTRNKMTKLYTKLDELKSKLESDELTPFKRFMLENKLSIIETRLEKQLSKLKIQQMEEENLEKAEERDDQYYEQLEAKYYEINDICDKIEQKRRNIEQKTTNARNREEDFKEINEALRKQGKEIYNGQSITFSAPEKLKASIKREQTGLQKLQNKKDLKEQEIKDFINEYTMSEKSILEEEQNKIQEYRPSFWKSLKTVFTHIGENFRNWRNNAKAEKQAIKEAKTSAIRTSREQQVEGSMASMNKRNEEFKNRYNVEIPVEQQSKIIEEIVNEEEQQEEDLQK